MDQSTMPTSNESLLHASEQDAPKHLHTSRKREIMAGIALLMSIFGFVLQTETLGKVATLGYQKPMFVMYITHSCMSLLLPLQIVVLWLAKLYQRHESFGTFFNKHTTHLKQTMELVAGRGGFSQAHLLKCFIYVCSVLAVAVNCAGASWYIAVNMTTTADLTAIYNCSTFFAYGFSVLLLKEKIHPAKLCSVILSIIGVFIVAYLGSARSSDDTNSPRRRTMGNIIIAFGTILYGLYEVLYKKIACAPQTVSARKQAAFANVIGSGIGVATAILMFPFLFVIHFAGWERFQLPSAVAWKYIIASIVGNVTFSGSFLILMALTSPVLGSISSLLATCVVPLVNFIIWRQSVNLAEILGGLLIIAAFVLMAWASTDDFIEDDEGDEEGDL